MSIVLFDLGLGGRLEAVPAWPEGPFKISDFPILYGAARSQIEHLVSYAEAIALLHELDEANKEQLALWAREFFLIGAYRKQIDWFPLAAVAASRICYDHCSVPLHGPNFHSELVRIRGTKAFVDEADRRLRERIRP